MLPQRPEASAMTDISDRFSEAMPCGCSYEQGQWFFCARHQPLHGDHPRPVPGCLDCEDALQEAREIEAQAPWNDQ